jgi:RNA polymerase sigma factor (sigma-70 family)
VASTLDDVAWSASVFKADVAEELAALKSQDGGHIMKYGVTALDRTLLDHKLVDEYDLWIMPTLVGQGKRAFADIDADKLDLELVRTHRFANGVMALTYHPRYEAAVATSSDEKPSGRFDAQYRAFLETVTHVRGDLHRYCARMTGSVFDGEDVAQEALFEAYRNLDKFDESRPLKPWLFGIAHNRCIDFLRKRKVRVEAETALAIPDSVAPEHPASVVVRPALERLVTSLPPMERACVLLKDVFDYSLEEIADLLGSTVGGVKSALNRGRTKLANRAGFENLNSRLSGFSA